MSHAIEIERLHYRFDKAFEIKELDLHVPTGSIYGFLGPNGSGKTTTIRLILGLLRPLSGRITVLGDPMPEQHARILGRVGYVPEQPHLDATLTVRELIAFQAPFYPRWERARADELLERFELDGTRLFGRLSKGQKAKLMILLALAQCGDLLVLDEPTDGLDPVVRRDILSALLTYVSERGATIFISSHLVHELERVCDWVAVMDDGRLITEAPMEKLKHGTKRLVVTGAPAEIGHAPPPFRVLARESSNGAGENWVVGDWEPGMTAYFDRLGASVREVIDLDLEDGFVELLRSFRTKVRGRA
ncbi:MAG TPA: ABC transporter ATP-binding protein [Gemmatimonadales bacterium]|jgi:ABC-2 type transport system ATP-binding protein|nr:ABC transporter ATP-binding protein [Gemmatimonadales bacterium]